ncbi:MAG: ABC transporter substrate-binding protein [Motilibacteraceae bacterium]
MSAKRVSLAAVAALALALAGCGGGSSSTNSSSSGSASASGGGSSSGKTITIGSIHPLTGALAGAGSLMDDAAKMAVDDINAAGGIKAMNGAKLKLESGDSQGKAEVGQSEAQRLIQAGAVALVGTYQSDVTKNVATVAERSQVPLVIDVAVDDSILAQGYKYAFRIQPDATGMGTSGADDLADLSAKGGAPIKTVSYIHIQGAFGDSVFKAFQKEASAKGISVAKEVTYAGANFNDASTQVSEAASAKPDAIVVTGYYPDSLLIAKSLAALKPPVKAVYGIANGGFDDDQFPTDAGAAGQGILSANYHYAATSARVKDIRQRFQTKYGHPMETAAVLSYEAVEVIAKALEQSKDSDPKKLRDAIAGISVDDPLLAFDGPITFDEKGQNKNATVIVMQIQSGKVEQVFPDKFATTKLIYPAAPGQS